MCLQTHLEQQQMVGSALIVRTVTYKTNAPLPGGVFADAYLNEILRLIFSDLTAQSEETLNQHVLQRRQRMIDITDLRSETY